MPPRGKKPPRPTAPATEIESHAAAAEIHIAADDFMLHYYVPEPLTESQRRIIEAAEKDLTVNYEQYEIPAYRALLFCMGVMADDIPAEVQTILRDQSMIPCRRIPAGSHQLEALDEEEGIVSYYIHI